MAEEALVADEVEAGAKLLETLDRQGALMKAAFWLHYPDQDDWKLVLSPREATKGVKSVYFKIGEALRSPEMRDHRLDIGSIKILQPDEPLVKALSQVIRAEGINRIRFSRNMINGIYVDDAVIYRTAA